MVVQENQIKLIQLKNKLYVNEMLIELDVICLCKGSNELSRIVFGDYNMDKYAFVKERVFSH